MSAPMGERLPDRDLVSGMLTAIRDFASDAFGRASEGQLDTIEYGGAILIEAAQHIYLAVVGKESSRPVLRAPTCAVL